MEIKKLVLAAPVKFFVSVDENTVEEKKIVAYDKVKHDILLPGFRKGHVPRDVAEKQIKHDKLYKDVIDSIYYDIVDVEPIVESFNDSFEIYCDFSKKAPFSMTFVANVKPIVKLSSIQNIVDKIKKESIEVTEADMKSRIDHELKQNEILKDSQKIVLENLDIAIIDFEGRLEGVAEPFKGGTAKNYRIKVNEDLNGQKAFIDNFEDQLVGMKVGEIRDVKVKFPVEYKEKSLAGKNAIFTVELKAIKDVVAPEYTDVFVQTKGFSSKEDYEVSLRKSIEEIKKKNASDNFKKSIVAQMIQASEISVIPEIMIKRENEKEWESMLRKMGKTEEEFEKTTGINKTSFFHNTTSRSEEVIKLSLVFEEVAKNFNISCTDEEVVDYASKMSTLSKLEPEKIIQEMKSNKHYYKTIETAKVNEKVIDFLVDEVSKLIA